MDFSNVKEWIESGIFRISIAIKGMPSFFTSWFLWGLLKLWEFVKRPFKKDSLSTNDKKGGSCKLDMENELSHINEEEKKLLSTDNNKNEVSVENESENFESSKKIEPKFTKPPSLMNVGATCYLNSALQGISSCDIFLEELSQLHKKYANLEKLSLFHNLIDILNGGKSNYLEISRNSIFRNWNKPGQQDSFELLAYVMNQVYNEIRKDLEEKGKIPKRDMQAWLKEELPMRIIIEYEIRCSCNSKVQVPLQSDLALHVAIPLRKISDLQNLVDEFFKEDDIEDYECDMERCNGEGAKRFTRLLRPLPRTLCIHLQRTFWNGWKMQKIDRYIEFPKVLKINSKFTVKNNKTSNSKINKQIEENIPVGVESKHCNHDLIHKHEENINTNNDVQLETLNICLDNKTFKFLRETNTKSQIQETLTTKCENVSDNQLKESSLNDNEDLLKENNAKNLKYQTTDPNANKPLIDDVKELKKTLEDHNAKDSNLSETGDIQPEVQVSSNDTNSENLLNENDEKNENLQTTDLNANKPIIDDAEKLNKPLEDHNAKDSNVLASIANQLESQTSTYENDTETLLDENIERNKDLQTTDTDELSENDENYLLSSVIVHYGSVYGGHYVCYKKMNNKWFLTDDSSIREVYEADVLNCNAYILFYEKS